MSNSISSKPNGLFKSLLSFIMLCGIAGLGYLILLNQQPWIAVAEHASKSIKILPFQDTLIAIPFLGGLVMWIVLNASKLLAIALWGLCNGIQTLPFILETSFAEKIPKEILKDLNLYRAIAYVTEAIVCWLAYPTYRGSWPAVVRDFPNYSWDLIDWSQVASFLLALGAFEICVQLGLRLYAIRIALNSAK